MSKRNFTTGPYHADPYKKHRITDEELDFLQELQKEMNTQDTCGQGNPRIWVIREPARRLFEIDRDITEDEDAIPYLEEISDGSELYIDGWFMKDHKKLYDTISKIIKDDHLEQKYEVVSKNGQVVIYAKNMMSSSGSIEWNKNIEIVDWINNYTFHDAELKYYKTEVRYVPGIFFLTYRDGVKYLEKYASQYDKDARLFAMSPKGLFTDCSPEIEKLFDILHKVDFSKRNRKIYISGKISGTDDYLERFAAAEKILSEQGYEVVNPAHEGTKLKDASYEDYMELSFQLLKDCDIIYMLKDWKTSQGANQEYGYALAKNMEIRFEK